MQDNGMSRRSLIRTVGAAGAVAALPGTLAYAADPAVASTRPALVDPATPLDAQPHGGPLATRAASTLVFSDEFTGTGVDTNKWNILDVDRGAYWYKASNVRVTNSALAIDISNVGDGTYGGGRIDSQGQFDFAFGTIEYSIHIPPTQGHLAAAWLQASNGVTPGGVVDGTARDGAEIDIMETFSTGNQYGVTVHWDGYGADHQQSGATVSAPGLHDTTWYHTVTLDWTSTRMTFSYDGTVVRTVTDPNLISQVREFPIASHEVIPYAQGNIADAPLDYTSTMYVDYIRVWQ
ncbi:family 16 glycosylhydrolase [Streptomyces sp. NPDC058695]|uniref:glycoside hydrolase family 16 protein n=1 Tax=Streptomyces sp. NPDC058695 TaxID=3346604 RepID=UPI003656104D